MDLYSIVIYILRRFPGLSIYSCAAVEIMDTPLPPPNCLTNHKHSKAKRRTACAHAPNQPTTHPKTMTVVAAEGNQKSSWESDSTAFGLNILSKMRCKEGYGLGNY